MSYSKVTLNFKRQKLNLIINADDFSYGEPRDRGIIQLIKAKRCSSISVIINGQNITNFEQHIKKNLLPNQIVDLSIGLHLNLTEGNSVSNQQLGVLTKSKKFLGKSQFYRQISKQGFVLPKWLIQQQIQSQIIQFIKIVGVRPTHIDGHNHIHVIPQIAQLLASTMIRFGIYRTRLPIEKLSKQHQFNQIFVKNAIISKQIFDKHKIIYPKTFIGLQMINNFTIDSICSVINAIDCQITQQKQNFVELMCHPGYSDHNSAQEFSRSNDRQKQKQVLLSKQLANIISQITGPLKSFRELQSDQNNLIEPNKRLLIYSKMVIGSGNYTTTLRYKRIFEELGFRVYLRSVQNTSNFKQQVDDLAKFIYNFKISLVIGINITNCARQIYHATNSQTEILYRVPFILIIAGTDANVALKQKNIQIMFKQPIKSSLCLVSLSEDMSQKVKKCLQVCKISKQIISIEQSIQNSKKDPKLDQGILSKFQVSKSKFIIFPTSFRKVKAVDHLLQCLNEIQKQYQIPTIIAGPILDRAYFEQILPKLQSVRYIGSIPKQQIDVLVRNSLILINTSQSQGMSCSILQAFECQTLVIARRNEGNQNLIKNQQNGFLYETPEQFLKIFKRIICPKSFSDNKIKVQKAFDLIQNRFCYLLQKQKFSQLLQKYYFSRFKSIQLLKNGETIHLQLFNADQVHPVSLINSQLYQSIKHSQIKPKHNQQILDLATGSGIMGLIYTRIFDCSQGSITFSDLSTKILGACVFNWRINSGMSDPCQVTFVRSNMFQNLPKNSYDTILTCLPQSPFQIKKSRPDKNGGLDGTQFNFQLIREWKDYSLDQESSLIMFYSYMCWPDSFFELIKKQMDYIKWRSFRKNYCIAAQAFDEMEEGLSEYIKLHLKKGRAEIQFNGIEFIVPAQLLLIKVDNRQ